MRKLHHRLLELCLLCQLFINKEEPLQGDVLSSRSPLQGTWKGKCPSSAVITAFLCWSAFFYFYLVWQLYLFSCTTVCLVGVLKPEHRAEMSMRSFLNPCLISKYLVSVFSVLWHLIAVWNESKEKTALLEGSPAFTLSSASLGRTLIRPGIQIHHILTSLLSDMGAIQYHREKIKSGIIQHCNKTLFRTKFKYFVLLFTIFLNAWESTILYHQTLHATGACVCFRAPATLEFADCSFS